MELPIFTRAALFLMALVVSLGLTESSGFAQEILEIPRLSGDLPVGTLAWATLDQVHPAQPQTGFREVKSSTQDFLQILQRSHGDLPTGLMETLLKKGYIIPVHVAATPPWDSRFGREPVLGFATDRTHKAAALAQAYSAFFDERGLSEPRFDSRGRVLNFILVRVEANHCALSPKNFAANMVQGGHCYLTKFSLEPNGLTDLIAIDFWDLPEKIYETEDNPFRGLIGALQRQGFLQKSKIHFSEFRLAEELVRSGIVEWSEITEAAGPMRYRRALQRAADYFRMKKCVAALLDLSETRDQEE